MTQFYPPFFLRFQLLLLLLLALTYSATASHIVGGELNLQYISGSNYRLGLNLYFDAINGRAELKDATLTASIFEKGTNRRMQNVTLRLISDTFVSYTNPACAIGRLSTSQLQYTVDVTLAAATYTNPTGYYVAVERCCRNATIQNILTPSGTGQAYYLEFPAVVRNGQPFVNSTPRIFPPLSDYACQNELFYYNFGGQDADGDSLVYEMATPLGGHASSGNSKPAQAEPEPYAPVRWTAGRSELDQIPGNPTMTIGRATGQLMVRPTQLGIFVFGVKCSEYRRGVKIGEVRRDFQMLVVNCTPNTQPSARVLRLNSSQPYQPGRDTIRLTPTSGRCLTVRTTDPDPNSQLTLSVRAVNFTGALPTLSPATGTVRAANAPDTLVSQLCFPNCFTTAGGVYLLDIIVADNGCSLPKRDTVRVAVTAAPTNNTPPQLTTTAGPTLPLRARVGDVITFDVVGIDPDQDALVLTMTGQDFSPAAVGATLTPIPVPNGVRGRFSWAVTCAAIARQRYDFVFTITESLCGGTNPVRVTVPVLVEYENAPPVLTTTLPPGPENTVVVVRQALGRTYEATLRGLDADQDALALTAVGNGFDLAAAGMRFAARNGAGQATATFQWDPLCEVSLNRPLEVTFRLQESSCESRFRTRTVRFELVSADTLAFKPANIFTPNHDHVNDVFEMDLPPDFCGSYFAHLRIFNRWGTEVYHTRDRNAHWDGGDQASGVYFYFIEYTDKRRYKGAITLAR